MLFLFYKHQQFNAHIKINSLKIVHFFCVYTGVHVHMTIQKCMAVHASVYVFMCACTHVCVSACTDQRSTTNTS